MPHRIRCLATLALTTTYVIQLTGCTSWKPITSPLPQVLEANPGKPVRITLDDGKRVTLGEARLVTDTLEGVRAGDISRTVRRVPPDRIRGIELQHPNPGGTVALVAGTVVVVGLGIASIVAMESLGSMSFGLGYARERP